MKEKIISILKHNARITDGKIADILGLTEAEVTEEIKSLEENGVIKGYSLILDEARYDGSAVSAIIELKVTPQKGSGFDDIARTIMMYDEVESVSLMSGGYDLSIQVKGINLRDVAMFVSERLSAIEGVLSTATHFFLKRYKEKGIIIDGEDIDERGFDSP